METWIQFALLGATLTTSLIAWFSVREMKRKDAMELLVQQLNTRVAVLEALLNVRPDTIPLPQRRSEGA